ncbi:S8 family serine peptidase [Rhodocytophaga rosea]|uniref:S8 family serine peptidase n=1 Tax=Rhodocytophaga rosea TaxID=2704465 RepID=A0A6C0GQK5_9BACT|nr:PKD domain-containing protein [Rhodocytophaga rosea]QHT69893.1 S8 family serine peptidase [Rhodocytophaga rosea]
MKKRLLVCCILLLWVTGIQAQKRPFQFHLSTKKGDYLPHTLIVKYKPEAILKKTNKAKFAPDFSTSLKKLGVKESRQLFNWKKPANHAQNINKNKKSYFSQLSLIHRIELDPSVDLQKAINLLLSDPAIEYAEPIPARAIPLHVPNDTYASAPTGDPYAGSIYNGKQYYLSTIKAYEAWDVQKGDPNVTIGIIDFGIDINHEDLKDNIKYNLGEYGLDELGDDKRTNGIDDDEDGYTDNYAGWNAVRDNGDLKEDTHGTRVGGVAAGTPDNGKGIAGVGYNCTYIPVTAYEINNPLFYGWYGVEYALLKGAKIINLSYATGRKDQSGYSQAEQDLINIIINDFDAIVVAAAGNENGEIDYYPASYDNVLSVGASDAYDVKAGFATYSKHIDIMAPGYLAQTTIDNSLIAGGYGADNGSSYAAPQVAGAAALIRSQFPNLTATEVMQRLLATADDIYNLPGNAAYIGKLGKGRLNVYRAVTEMVKITDTEIKGFDSRPFLWANQEASFSFEYFNHINRLNDFQVSLSTNSPYIDILDGTAAMGFLDTQETVAQDGDPFRIFVKQGTPVNTKVTFKLTYTDGIHTGFDYVTFIVNPDYLNIDINEVQLTATSRGRVGFNDMLKADGGIGVVYGNKSLLSEAGLMLGTSATKVSNNISNVPGVSKDNLFTTLKQIWYNSSNNADISAGGIFTDTISNANQIGLVVTHQSYAWQEAPNDKYVIVEYKIKNVGNDAITDLYAGMFADWDIGDKSGNVVQWDAANQLGYVYNKNSGNVYAGVQLLSSQTPHYYALDDISGTNMYDGFSKAEKFAVLSGGLTKTTSTDGATDVAHTLSAQIQNLQPNATITVAFAFLAADNLTDLKAAAQVAKAKFIEVKTGPVPELPDIEACKNEAMSLAPLNGNVFKLYNSFPLTTPIAQGNTFNLGLITKDSTYYLTNVDSLYESEPLTLLVKSINHISAFNMVEDTIGLQEQELLQVLDKTAGAVKWQWDFGDNTTSKQQNPTHIYANPGKYTVKLTTENSMGCKNTVTKEVLVVNGKKSLTPDVSPVTICINEGVTVLPTNGTNFKLYNSLPLTSPVAAGSSFFVGNITRDTVLYVTCTDFLFESEPAAVNIKVAPIRANFTFLKDTLSLFDNEKLNLADKSQHAVKWQWDFGNGTTSRQQNPGYTYTIPGEYTIMLEVENANGCKDSFTRDIVVVNGRKSLKPLVSNINACRNESVQVAPGNGELFNFYTSLPLTSPVATGKTLELGQALKDTLLYVTCIDFLYESEPVAVQIKVSGISANFQISKDTINLEQQEILNLTDKTSDAVKWLWQFGDGQTSTEQNPSHLYTETGEYTIILLSENASGCQDSHTAYITVVRTTGLAEELSKAIQIFPVPSTGKVYLKAEDKFSLLLPAQVQVISQLGQIVHEQTIYSANQTFDLTHLLKGVYMVRISSGNHQVMKRIILQ